MDRTDADVSSHVVAICYESYRSDCHGQRALYSECAAAVQRRRPMFAAALLMQLFYDSMPWRAIFAKISYLP